jgi:uncharacterized protein HemX
MKSRLNQNGSAHLVAILAVIVIALTGVVGYRVMQLQNKDKVADTDTTQTADGTLESSADLQDAEDAIDADESDTNLDPAQLDSDLDNLL